MVLVCIAVSTVLQWGKALCSEVQYIHVRLNYLVSACMSVTYSSSLSLSLSLCVCVCVNIALW